MNMVLQLSEPASASANSSTKARVSPNDKKAKSFQDCLKSVNQDTTESSRQAEDDSEDGIKEEKTAVLSQLLIILYQHRQTKDSNLPSDANVFGALVNFEKDFPVLEMTLKSCEKNLAECWQDILHEFNASGKIDTENISKFYQILKDIFPDFSITEGETADLLNKTLIATLDSNKNNGSDVSDDINSLPNKPEFFISDFLTKDSKKADNVNYVKEDKIINNENRKDRQTLDKNSANVLISKGDTISAETLDITNTANKNSFQDLSNMNLQDIFLKKSSTVATAKFGSELTSAAKTDQNYEIFNQLIDKINFAIKENMQQVNIRLKPDYLGNILIKLTSSKDKLRTEFFVENAQLRDVLKMHAIDFQSQIKERGYEVSEINVYNLSDGLDLSTSDQRQSNNYNRNKAKGVRNIFGSLEEDGRQALLENHYDQWGNISQVNYIV